MTKKKETPPLPEQFFYDVRCLDGSRHQVAADSIHHEAVDEARTDTWLVFRNRDAEIFRHRVSRLAGWARCAKPGVTA